MCIQRRGIFFPKTNRKLVRGVHVADISIILVVSSPRVFITFSNLSIIHQFTSLKHRDIDIDHGVRLAAAFHPVGNL